MKKELETTIIQQIYQKLSENNDDEYSLTIEEEAENVKFLVYTAEETRKYTSETTCNIITFDKQTLETLVEIALDIGNAWVSTEGHLNYQCKKIDNLRNTYDISESYDGPAELRFKLKLKDKITEISYEVIRR